MNLRGSLLPFLLLALHSYGQPDDLLHTGPPVNLAFERVTVNDGLSQGMVRSIIQDSKGYIWFSTKDGLDKYDGYHMTVYRHDPADSLSIPENEISSLLEDAKGNLWVGTATKGVCLFDRREEKFYPIPSGPRNKDGGYEDLRSLQYQDGRLILGFEQHIRILDVRHIIPGNYATAGSTTRLLFSTDDVMPANSVESLRYLLLADGSIYISTPDSCFFVRENHGFAVTPMHSRKQAASSTALPPGTCEDAVRPRYYVLSAYCGDGDIRVFDHLLGQGHNYVYRAFSDATRKIWVLANGGTQNGLFQYDPVTHRFQRIGSINPEISRLLQNAISFCIDRNGIVWLGTAGYGVIKFDSRLNRFNNKNLCSIYYLNFDKAGRLNYFPADHRVDPAVFDLHTGREPRPLLPRSWEGSQWRVGDVTAIINDAKGNYWTVVNSAHEFLPGSATSCLLRFDPARDKVTLHLPSRTPDGYRYKNMICDREGNLWVLGYHPQNQPVLIRYDDQQDKMTAICNFPVYEPMDGYPFVSDWWEDRQGVFWFGTRQGIYRFDPKRNAWQTYRNTGDSLGIPSNKTLSLCPDPQQPARYLWVGTQEAGFYRFEYGTGRCTRWNTIDGLPNDVVYGILPDEKGNLWMSTNRGLSCFTPPLPGKSRTEGRFINFQKNDGIQDDEFNRFAYKKAPDGELVFGGVNGITWFRPEDVLNKETPPAPVFTGLSVFDKPVDYKTNGSIISLPVDYAASIVLPADQNMFTLSFAELEFVAPEKKKYEYRLDGFDKQWINNGSKNEATYTNLSPGKYLFHVRAAGRDGIWNVHDRTIAIIITPSWWATWWFRCLVIATAASLLYGIYRYRLRQALQVQKMRNRIASDLHDEIGSTLSSISLSSAVIRNKLSDDLPAVNGLLTQISSNTDNMMEAMSDIVWSINTRNDRFENITARMRAFVAEICEPLDIAAHLRVSEPAGALKLDMEHRRNLYLIFKEAVNNAAKYSDCVNIWIDIRLKGPKRLEMSIRDDGKGFITQATVRSGNGLINIRKRAQELKGRVDITSLPGKGTEVLLDFPI